MDSGMTDEHPRSFRDPNSVARRRKLLVSPHMGPLVELTEGLRAEGRGTVPDFDPADAGVNARILFLMEKPGPMTDDLALAGRVGSGFISRDNDDPTAEAIFHFMQQAGIPRQESILWNIVPWWNGSRRIEAAELRDGLDRVGKLTALLPNLRVVVGVGGKAQRAARFIEGLGLPFVPSAHPSPINRAARPAVWQAIPDQWAQARAFI